MSLTEKIQGVVGMILVVFIIGAMAAASLAFVWEAWTIGTPATQAQIRWEALDNEWDRNMHDPSQRPPDSIANEARLRMLLLEEEDRK